MLHDHLRRAGHLPVKPTSRMLRYWWGRLNAECFDGVLLPAQITFGDEATPGYTTDECDGVTFPLPGERVRIHIATSQNIKAGFLATLSHEMIHQYQHQHGLPMTHGTVFDTWAAKIKAETGMTC